MSESIFDEDVGNGLFIPQRPDFSDLIRKFAPTTISEKRQKLKGWFFVEYYAEPEKFAEITNMIKSQINGTHQINSDFFYKLIKEKFNKE